MNTDQHKSPNTVYTDIYTKNSNMLYKTRSFLFYQIVSAYFPYLFISTLNRSDLMKFNFT